MAEFSDRPSFSLSDRLLNALTQQEIAQRINALFSILSPMGLGRYECRSYH